MRLGNVHRQSVFQVLFPTCRRSSLSVAQMRTKGRLDLPDATFGARLSPKENPLIVVLWAKCMLRCQCSQLSIFCCSCELN